MNQQFDIFNNPELPYIILCNLSREELFSLGAIAYNTKITIKLNAISEFEFDYPSSIDGGKTPLDAFDYLQNKRLILIERFGYFQIVDSELNLDGAVPVRHVVCQSQESELILKRVTTYSGTKKLWDFSDSTGTILGDMLVLAPNYTVGNISSSLLTLYRTFNISDTNIYDFLVNDVSKAFGCIIIFDTTTRTISAYTPEDLVKTTDIFLSFDNVLSKAKFSEKSDEIVTSLSVYGGGDLTINLVNPLGGNKIYNFDYYANTNWMSQGLVTAINSWKVLVDSQKISYSSFLILLEQYNSELLSLKSQLATLNEEYLSIEGVQKLRIQTGQPYSDINTELENKQAEIDAQNLLITNKQTQINDINSDLQSIVTSLSFENNFTPTQLLELNNFMFENTYQNENIILTDSMTTVETQQQSQQLFDQSLDVLGKVSQPRYEFSLDLINFISLSQFEVFTNQLELGCVVYAEIKDGTIIETVLLEIEMQFDDPTNFKMTFSNRLRLDDGKFTYSDLMGQVVKTGSSVSFDSSAWSNWSNDYKDSVTGFITSALDTTVNNLISNSNQEILINQNGLRARQSDGSGGYEGKQAWLVNNVLAFSDDGFQTAKLALGEINLPEGGTAYGLVGDVIVGKILAGNNLTIANEGNNFTLDSTGATLNNAKFSIQTTNTKIIIDPTASNAFVIQKNDGGTFNNKFTVTNSGDVIFSGTLSGADGTFSGTISASIGNIGTLVIDSNGLKTSNGQNYIRGNGDLKWGGLTISGSTAVFNGNIFANNIKDSSNSSVFSSSGIMSGGRINGGSPTVASLSSPQINFGTGASMFISGTGMEIIANGTISISSSNGGASISAGSTINLSGGSRIDAYTPLYIRNTLYMAAGSYPGTGKNVGYAVTTPYGTKVLYFSNGILTNFT